MGGQGRYTLYGGGGTRSMMVEMVLAETGAPYELVEVDISQAENRAPEFLAINPLGWVPALVTPDGEVIGETPAINLWLCERHGLDLVVAPGDPARGRFLMALHNVTGEIEPTMKRVFYPHRYAPDADQTGAARTLAWTMLAERLQPLDQWLARAGPYFLGERFSLADLTLAYWMPYAERRGLLRDVPAIERLLAMARARPALAPVFARLEARIRR